jgi:ATP-binding cassette subfamily B protein
MDTVLGESGSLVSGGEGQRVRLARALFRTGARLVVLDEPFRGLDRALRHTLLLRALAHWQDATLVCATHDVREAHLFDRVFVIEEGVLVEAGTPTELLARPDSKYRALLAAETRLADRLWKREDWRRISVERGKLL